MIITKIELMILIQKPQTRKSEWQAESSYQDEMAGMNISRV